MPTKVRSRHPQQRKKKQQQRTESVNRPENEQLSATSTAAPRTKPVPRAVWPGRQAFYERFVHPSQPVVFTSAARDWPCTQRWTPEYLSKVGRGVAVEIACGCCEETRDGNARRHKLCTTLDAFVKSVSTRSFIKGGSTAMSSSNHSFEELGKEEAASSVGSPRRRRKVRGVLKRRRTRTVSSGRRTTKPGADASVLKSSIPESAYLKQCEIGYFAKLPSLRADVFPEKMFSPWAIFGCCNLWIGDENATKTGLHNDDEHNVLCQIRGQKRVILIAPEERDNIYPNILYDSGTECCDVNASNPDLQRHPLFACVGVRFEVVLEPGDVLFLPRFWYHEVQPMGSFSVSVNYFCSTPLDQLRWGVKRAILGCLHGAGVYKRGKCVCCSPPMS